MIRTLIASCLVYVIIVGLAVWTMGCSTTTVKVSNVEVKNTRWFWQSGVKNMTWDYKSPTTQTTITVEGGYSNTSAEAVKAAAEGTATGLAKFVKP